MLVRVLMVYPRLATDSFRSFTESSKLRRIVTFNARAGAA